MTLALVTTSEKCIYCLRPMPREQVSEVPSGGFACCDVGDCIREVTRQEAGAWQARQHEFARPA